MALFFLILVSACPLLVQRNIIDDFSVLPMYPDISLNLIICCVGGCMTTCQHVCVFHGIFHTDDHVFCGYGEF